jgi:hypothetical protein
MRSEASSTAMQRRVWVDLADAAGEERGAGAGEGAAGAFSAAPLRQVEEAAERSEDGQRVVLEALEMLRRAASSGQQAVAGGVAEAGSGGAGVLRAEGGPSAASAASRFRAFLARLQVLLERPASAGAVPSEVLRRAASVLRAAGELVAAEESAYPQLVRAASGRALNESLRALRACSSDIREATRQTERAVANAGAARDRTTAAVSAEATAAVLRLRDRVMRGQGVRRLVEDLAARGAAGEGVALQAASLPAHLSGLLSAASAEAVRREAECALLALGEGGGGGGTLPSSASGELASLLGQISNAERRREFATMAPERAAVLLAQTRETLGRVQHAAETERRLRVVARILELRAQGSAAGSGAGAAGAAYVAEVRRELGRLAESAQLAEKSVRAAGEDGQRRAEEMRSALRRAVSQMAGKALAATEGTLGRWGHELTGAYARSQAAVLERAQAVGEAVVASLEMLASEVAGAGGAGVAGGAETGWDDEFGSLSEWQRGRGTGAFVEEDGVERHAVTASAMSKAPGAASNAASNAPKAYALVLDGFLAWVAFAQAVLRSNAEGTLRAAAAVRSSLQAPRREAEGWVAQKGDAAGV